MEFRTEFGDLNSFILDSLRGLDETIQYGQGKLRSAQIDERSRRLDAKQKYMKELEGAQRGMTNVLILLFSFGMLFLSTWLVMKGQMEFEGGFLCTILMMGSFGPVTALSSLSNNLMQTLASGERVLSIMEEEPVVDETEGEEAGAFGDISCGNLDFAYDDEQILKDYSIEIPEGSRIGIHGKSGSGKSTLLKLIMRFYDPDQGSIRIHGRDLKKINTDELRNMESYVTQETCLFHDSIANNIAVAKPGASRQEIEEAAKKASLHEFIMSLPNGYDTPVGELGDTLSGGERQRIGIARALAVEPKFIVCDEPISALDVSIQAQVVNLLMRLQKEMGLTYLFISHDLSMIQHISDRVGVMYLGSIVELAPKQPIYSVPKHPYTQALISAIPVADPEADTETGRIKLEGEVPSPLNPPSGCKFRTRCRYATERCANESPQLREVEPDHFVACHLYDN